MERKELPQKEGAYLLYDFSSLKKARESEQLIENMEQMKIPVYLIDNSSREYLGNDNFDRENIAIRTLNNIGSELFHYCGDLSLVRTGLEKRVKKDIA